MHAHTHTRTHTHTCIHTCIYVHTHAHTHTHTHTLSLSLSLFFSHTYTGAHDGYTLLKEGEGALTVWWILKSARLYVPMPHISNCTTKTITSLGLKSFPLQKPQTKTITTSFWLKSFTFWNSDIDNLQQVFVSNHSLCRNPNKDNHKKSLAQIIHFVESTTIEAIPA